MQWLIDLIKDAISASVTKIRVYRNGNQNIPNNTWTQVLFNAENYDTRGEFAASQFTATVAGYYQVNITLYLSDAVANTLVLPAIYKNGVRFSSARYHPAFNSHFACGYSDIVGLNIGDTLQGWIIHTSGAAKNLNGLSVYTFMGIHRIV